LNVKVNISFYGETHEQLHLDTCLEEEEEEEEDDDPLEIRCYTSPLLSHLPFN
jgi:hypothetical protein